jgi:hypothetical protein
MLQVPHKDVAKVDQDIVYVAMGYTCMFKVYIPNVSFVSEVCCNIPAHGPVGPD